jgi:hypothetical protein
MTLQASTGSAKPSQRDLVAASLLACAPHRATEPQAVVRHGALVYA